MKKIIALFSMLVTIMFFVAGCGPSYVVVRSRPEPPMYARPAAPGPEFVWVEGEWVPGGRGYVYRQGYWMRPKRRYHQYVGGHWQEGRGGWYWQRGHWN